MAKTVSAEARLRARNQMTIPQRVAAAAGIAPGDTFVIEHDATNADTLRLRRIRTSYAGALRGLYGTADAYLERERRTWEHG